MIDISTLISVLPCGYSTAIPSIFHLDEIKLGENWYLGVTESILLVGGLSGLAAIVLP